MSDDEPDWPFLVEQLQARAGLLHKILNEAEWLDVMGVTRKIGTDPRSGANIVTVEPDTSDNVRVVIDSSYRFTQADLRVLEEVLE